MKELTALLQELKNHSDTGELLRVCDLIYFIEQALASNQEYKNFLREKHLKEEPTHFVEDETGTVLFKGSHKECLNYQYGDKNPKDLAVIPYCL